MPMRSLLAAVTLLAANARREQWDDLRWLGGGLRGTSCATQPWLRKLNATQHAMHDGAVAPRFVVVKPHGRAGCSGEGYTGPNATRYWMGMARACAARLGLEWTQFQA